MTDPLPMIFRQEQKMSADGHVLETKQLTVQGEDLEEVQKVFDKEWRKGQ